MAEVRSGPAVPVRIKLAEALCWPTVPLAPTLGRDGRCTCTWVVVTCGPGKAAMSRMKYRHAACPVRHEAGAR